MALLCASVVLAATDLQFERFKRRQGGRAKRSVLSRESAAPVELSSHEGRRHVTYNDEWCGVILDGAGFTLVTGTINVPTPKVPTGGSSGTEYSVSAWVGIDGDTCTSAILQTGIDMTVQGGEVVYDAWYEWYPDYSYDFSGFTISAGDAIKMTVSVTSKTAGKATMQNLTTGKTVTHSFTGEPALCETSAEWIIEDFEEGSTLVPLANFGTLEFYDAYAIENGVTVYPSGSTGKVVDMQQGSTIVCSCSVSGTGSNADIICAYE